MEYTLKNNVSALSGTIFDCEKLQERNSFWNNLFQKYDSAEDSPDIEIKDVVKKYGNVKEKISARNLKTQFRSGNIVKRSKPKVKLNRNLQSRLLNDKKQLLLLSDVAEISTPPKRRGRPCGSARAKMKCNTKENLKIEKPEKEINPALKENISVNSKASLTNNMHKKEITRLEKEVPRKIGRPLKEKQDNNQTKTENLTQISDTQVKIETRTIDNSSWISKNKVGPKRGRPPLEQNTVSKFDNESKSSNIKTAELKSKISVSDILGNPPRQRGRPRLHVNSRRECNTEPKFEMSQINSREYKFKIPEDKNLAVEIRKRGRPRLKDSIVMTDHDIVSCESSGNIKNNKFKSEVLSGTKPENEIIFQGRSRPRLKVIENDKEIKHESSRSISSRLRTQSNHSEDKNLETVIPRQISQPRLKFTSSNNDDIEFEISKANRNVENGVRKRGRPRLKDSKIMTGDNRVSCKSSENTKDNEYKSEISSATNVKYEIICRRRGRPRLKVAENTHETKYEISVTDDGKFVYKDLENNIIPRGRGRPRLKFDTDSDCKSSTQLKIQSLFKNSTSIENKKIKKEILLTEKNKLKSESLDDKNVINLNRSSKQERPSSKTSIQLEESEITCKRKKQLKLKTNTLYLVDPASRKEMEKQYPGVIQDHNTRFYKSPRKFVVNDRYQRAVLRNGAFMQSGSDKKLVKRDLEIKILIEEKLHSDLADKVFKRYCCQKASSFDEETLLFWHSAVKEEIIKLSKIVPFEELAQYMKSSLAQRISNINTERMKHKQM